MDWIFGITPVVIALIGALTAAHLRLVARVNKLESEIGYIQGRLNGHDNRRH